MGLSPDGSSQNGKIQGETSEREWEQERTLQPLLGRMPPSRKEETPALKIAPKLSLTVFYFKNAALLHSQHRNYAGVKDK